ncbi:hypothetical protein KPH14_003074 [Odynerus spinipes]|uniref:Uncharacterized protein n=1 Tax=Odynerus spinipes TaxID=1348599 RepID=A0AAD9VV80_9HYME|nr:hypothetical protein KPH14_003074 [Odynerus spinipes]
MCALTSAARSTMLRRSKAPISFTQNFFEPTAKRSFSTTSIQDAEDRGASKKGGFLSKLKNIFNKSDDSSHEVHDTIANRQSTLAQVVYLENKFSNRRISRTVETNQKGDVNQEFTALKDPKAKETAGKAETEVHDISNMNLKEDNWNSDFERFYDLKEYTNQMNGLKISNEFTENPCNNPDPRNQYHFPTRSKSLFGCGTFQRTMNNSHVDCTNKNNLVPRSTKPPIREPNMPEKREKKDDRKEKKDKKPIIRTHEQYVKTAKRFLKINIGQNTQYVSNLAMTRSPATYSSNMSISRRTLSSRLNVLFKEISTTEALSKPTKQTESVIKSSMSHDSPILTIEGNQAVTKVSRDAMKQVDRSTEEVDILEEAALNMDAEISAWQTLVDKSKPPPEKKVEQELIELQLDKVSIRPEPPEPKLDVEMVKPLDTGSKDEEELEDSSSIDRRSTRSSESSRASNFSETTKVDSRKYHTFVKILPNRSFSNSTTPPSQPTESESAQRSNVQNQQLSKTKVQSDQNAFARSTARESENPKEGTPNESKRSSLPADFQSVNRKHEGNAGNPTETLDGVKGARAISLNHSKQDEAQSRGKQELHDLRAKDDVVHSHHYSEYPYSNMNVAVHDEYPYACLDESYSGENKYAQSQQEKEQRHEKQNLAETDAIDTAKEEEGMEMNEAELEVTVDEDYVRIPGDPYPYSREHFNKWRLPRQKSLEDTILKTLDKQENEKTMSEDVGPKTSPILGSSTLTNIEDSKNPIQKEKQPIREMSYDSHAHEKSYHAIPSNNFENTTKSKNTYQTRKPNERKFYVSSLNQQIVPECLRRGVKASNERDEFSLGKLMEEFSGDGNSKKDDQKCRWTGHGFRVTSEGSGGRA